MLKARTLISIGRCGKDKKKVTGGLTILPLKKKDYDTTEYDSRGENETGFEIA